jgi:hypothetical protein
MPDFPKLRSGVLDLQGGALSPLSGTLGLQGIVTKDGKTALADDFFGANCFSLVTSGFEASAHLSDTDQAILKAAGVQLISIGDHAGADAADAENTYHDFFESHGIAAMLVRPDFYIFGTCAAPDRISALVESLGAKLGIKETARA